MEDFISRARKELTGRSGGPLHLRLIVQPVLAATLTLRAGWKDARDHNPIIPYLIVRGIANRIITRVNAGKSVD